MKLPSPQNRLSTYSLSAAAFLSIPLGSALGQVSTTDVYPDVLVEDRNFDEDILSKFELDLNGDGIIDFNIVADAGFDEAFWSSSSWERVTVKPEGVNRVMQTGASASILYAGAYIGPAVTFAPGNAVVASTQNSSSWYSSSTYSTCGIADRPASSFFGHNGYIGLQFEIAGATHYGWARLGLNDFSSVYVQSNGYQASPSTSLNAGEGETLALEVKPFDLGGSLTAADFGYRVSAPNDLLSDEVRLMVVPESMASGFDATAAAAVSPSNYFLIPSTDTAVYEGSFAAGAADAFGNPIDQALPYRLFALSTGPAGYTEFSMADAPFELNPHVQVAENLIAHTYSGNKSLLTVNFDITNLADIDGFKIALVRAGSTFTLADAALLATDQITTIDSVAFGTAGLNPIELGRRTAKLFEIEKDTDGDPIVPGVDYEAYVLSKGYAPTQDQISQPSNTIRVPYNAPAPGAMSFHDISNSGFGSDLEVRFKSYLNFAAIDSYRVYVVPADSAGLFDEAFANSLPATHFEVVPAAKSFEFGLGIVPEFYWYEHRLSDATIDVFGDVLIPEKPYRFFVMSIGSDGFGNALSGASPSRSFDYASSVYVYPPFDVTAQKSRLADLSDFAEIAFRHTSYGDNVGSFRLLFRPADSVAFDLATAESLAPSHYLEVARVPGVADYIAMPDLATLDIHGNPLQLSQPYAIDILTVYGGAYPDAAVNLLTNELESLSLRIEVAGPTPIVSTDGNNEGNGIDLTMEVSGLADESLLDEYRIIVSGESEGGVPMTLDEAETITSFRPIGATSGGTVYQNMGPYGQTHQGEAIRNGFPYRAYTYAVGGHTGISAPSNEIVLHDPGLEARNIEITTDSAGEPILTFDPADKDGKVKSYYLGFVPAGEALEMYPSDIATTPNTQRLKVLFSPSLEKYKASLNDLSKDLKNQYLVDSWAYDCYIFTDADGFTEQYGYVVTSPPLTFSPSDFTPVSTGLDSPTSSDITAVYQNGVLYLDLGVLVGMTRLEIFNASGRLVHSGTVNDAKVSIPDLAQGHYLISLTADQLHLSGRFWVSP